METYTDALRRLADLLDGDFENRLSAVIKETRKITRRLADEEAMLGLKRALGLGTVATPGECNNPWKPFWWCPRCQERVEPKWATFEETHDGCGCELEWREPKANANVT